MGTLLKQQNSAPPPFGAPWPWPVPPPWCVDGPPFPVMPFAMPYPLVPGMLPPGANKGAPPFFPHPGMPTPPVYLQHGLPSEWSVMSTIDLKLPSAPIAAGYVGNRHAKMTAVAATLAHLQQDQLGCCPYVPLYRCKGFLRCPVCARRQALDRQRRHIWAHHTSSSRR